MKSYLVMGLFALYVVAVTLCRYLRDDEFFRVTAMKRLWGRSRGLVMHFLANVALPMVLGIVFLTQAAVQDLPRSSDDENVALPRVEIVPNRIEVATSESVEKPVVRLVAMVHASWEAPAP